VASAGTFGSFGHKNTPLRLKAAHYFVCLLLSLFPICIGTGRPHHDLLALANKPAKEAWFYEVGFYPDRKGIFHKAYVRIV
jgi:hypothetical protein